MKQKLIIPLFLLFVVTVSIQSCIHDEMYSDNNPLNKEYHSKSPFKEDELYIKNIMSIYEENENKIKKIGGTPLWNYAMTLGNLDETFLIVPILSNNKIITCIQVPRNESQVSFKYDNDPEHIKFFQAFVYSKQVRPVKQAITESNYSGKLTLCHVSSISMWYPDDNYVAGGYWETQYITKCDETGGGGPSNPDPNPQDPTYPYPGGGTGGTGNNNTNPCQKIKEKQNNAKYSQRFNDLNKPEIFNKSSERGFYELQPPIGVNAESGFIQVDGPPGTTGLDLPDNTDRISGLFHSHNNTEGSVKIFSPTDVKTFINIFLKNARVFAGSYAEAYSTVVSSEGSYTLKYSLITSPGGINYQTSEVWDIWYRREMSKIINVDDGSFDQIKVEKVFMQFLNEAVHIDGLEVYKVTSSTSSKLTYNPTTKQVSSTPCPQ